MGEIGQLLTAAAGGVQDAVGAVGIKGGGAPIPQTQSAPPLAAAGSLLPDLPGMGAQASGGSAPELPQSFAMPALVAALLGQEQQPMEEDDQEAFDNPYTPTDDPLEERMGKDIEVVGDSWQPKKMSPLDHVAEFFLGGVRERKDAANLRSAFEGFDRDPDRTFSRIRRHVDPKTAAELEQRYSTVEVNESRAEEIKQKMKIAGGKHIGSIVTPFKDNPEGYNKIAPAFRKMAEYFGFDPELIPKTYDEEAVTLIGQQGLSAYEHYRLDQQERGLQSLDTHRTEGRAEIRRHHEATEEETRRTHQVMEGLSSERLKLQKAKNGGMQNVFSEDRLDDQGREEFIGTLTPDGRTMGLRGSDGKFYAFRLRKPGDISSRVYAGDTETEILRKAIAKARGEEE